MKISDSTAPTRSILSQHPLNIESCSKSLSTLITPIDQHFVRNHGNVPQNDHEHSVVITGLVKSDITFTVSQLRSLSCKLTKPVTLICAGNRRASLHEKEPLPPHSSALLWHNSAISTAEYTGIPLTNLLKMVELLGSPSHIEFVGQDICEGGEEYAVSIPAHEAIKVLLAFDMNGSPLPAEHGGPLRAVCAGLVGARSCKWLNKVVFLNSPSTSKVQLTEYRWLDGSAIDEYPINSCMTKLEDGVLHGWAYVGGDKYVKAVHVCIDDSDWLQVPESNITAKVPHVWRLWHIRVPTTAKVIRCRAMDDHGNIQPKEPIWNPGGYIANHQDTFVIEPV